MTSKNNQPYFIALNTSSQSNSESVLYYDANASLDAIYECATARLHAVINLLENLYELKTQESTVTAVASVTSLLLNDATTLLESLEPIAMELRKQK
ncbi:hypothetical protein [Entomomonas asaccharolytica]|uniref:Uncharacterized protein n=1 Tax=Entomomonas asaccharolytica TaxID=2785331 RepID=A0A974RYU2_9GAMM|nr:hypothetical protein [Entomomonas asaccharolytica]QQP86284.1 hypothetical protein JHT90_03305 [Entomomonas asaccharolytica]